MAEELTLRAGRMLGMAGVVGTGLGGLRIYRILETTKIGKVGLKFRTKGFVSIVTKGDHLDSHKKMNVFWATWWVR